MISPEFQISRKYKQITISVNEMNRVLVKVPGKFYLPQAKKFFERNIDFVRKAIEKNNKKYAFLANYKFNFENGDKIFLFDEPTYEIKVLEAKKNSYTLNEKTDTLTLRLKDYADLNKTIEKFYRDLAYKLAYERSEYYADKLGVEFNSVRIKDTKTRWGSCSSNKNLNYNFRLLLAPERVFDYLVVHEVCHLKEMNHSSRYWKLVEGLMPDYKKQAKWLKEHGFILKYFLR